jgi:hypothetical protein
MKGSGILSVRTGTAPKGFGILSVRTETVSEGFSFLNYAVEPVKNQELLPLFCPVFPTLKERF